ncbi:MAG: asparaginase domain-containing protein [Candidatus Pseudoruminococcus sp.]|nr:asparaginase domain-containing protein [Ruminococcus sp.]MDY2782663.1 asparaginase domain-containing protein [Candidatus Pseudoruminococcus sp.]
MAKILIVLTGGTIGSISDGKIIDVDEKASLLLIDKYCKKYGKEDDFTLVQPLNIASENLELTHWETMINFILEYNINGFDGIIITHGSDTLSYSSAMLSMCLCHLPIPIVLTASNYTVLDERSNALNNFHSAVSMIKCFSRGVFTAFGDKIGKSRVFLPTRILEADGLTDTFQSFGGKELGFMNDEKFEFTKLSINPTKTEIEEPRKPILNGKLSLNKKIIFIRPYPGLNFSNIVISEDTGAVLLMTYHSSTARTAGNGSVLTLIENCRKCGIDVYCTPCKNKNEHYKSSTELIKAGCMPIYSTSPESSYAKLLLACNTDVSLLNRNIYFEVVCSRTEQYAK